MNTREIAGGTYSFVTKQRGGISVYRSSDRYARVGSKHAIERTLAMHTHLARLGFPVPKLLGEGEIDGDAYFIELSLGDKRMLELFEDDMVRYGTVADATFDSFLAVVERFLSAQMASERFPADRAAFAALVHLDLLCGELPQFADAIAAQFDRRLAAAASYPFVITHGDFNPANLYPSGVIDFEDVSRGPLGFDAVSAITINEWFPRSREYEYFERYRFSEDQVRRYFEHCDGLMRKNGLGPLSAVREHFEFFRAIWLTVRMHDWPKLQKYRYDLFTSKYLS